MNCGSHDVAGVATRNPRVQENTQTIDNHFELTRETELFKSNKNTHDVNNTKKLKVCVWNIHGLNNHKISKDAAGTFLLEHDIIMLSETWTVNTQPYSNFALSNVLIEAH